jgi:decaprenylphospho-beta-D-erythro-pentofuranosid-2-ulose 2-reductase
MPSNILVIGATSAIAQAYARRESAAGAQVFLVARDAARLDTIAADLRVRGAGAVHVAVLDVVDDAAQDRVLDAAWAALGRVDVALLAHGTLPDQARCETEPAYARAEFETNGGATIALMTRLAPRLQAQGAGTLAVISSVAGDRGRASNYLYGSAKAAVSAFASGLRQRLTGGGVNVLTIKPGFVDTPMTAQFKKGALWATPDQVAAGIARAIARGRGEAYLPGFWALIMFVIRHIPEFVFRKVKL